jgi:hypothetical protein
MRALLATAGVFLIVGSAVAAPGDPRALRGNLEWPATVSAEPIIVVRGDDGHVYYADISGARRMTAGAIAGSISLAGIEGNHPYEIAAVAVGAGDSALTVAPPPAPPRTEGAVPPATLPRQAATPIPPAADPSTPPSAVAPTPPAAPQAAPEGRPAERDDLWLIQGEVVSVSPQEFVVATRPGETVHVDVTKLSPSTRDTVRAGDHVKLFGVSQKDDRLVASGFVQEVAPGAPRR